jgi:hypothetical protein
VGDTEIGGFGIAAPNNPLYVEDFTTVKQQVTAVTVRFLDEAVADHFDSYQERGIPPSRSGRIWIHTHPGDSAQPTGTDEETFDRSFGCCDWAVIMILARSGQTYARLAFSEGRSSITPHSVPKITVSTINQTVTGKYHHVNRVLTIGAPNDHWQALRICSISRWP